MLVPSPAGAAAARADPEGGERVEPRQGGAERRGGRDLRRRRPLAEADPAGAPPAEEDVEGGERQRPEDAVGVAARRRLSRLGAGEAHGEM